MALSLKSRLGLLLILTLGMAAVEQSVARQSPPQPPVPPRPSTPPTTTPETRITMLDSNGRPVANSLAAHAYVIEIDAPPKTLLPVAPRILPNKGPILSDDLAQVPEVALQEKWAVPVVPAKRASDELSLKAIHQLAKIDHLNAKKPDGFLQTLIENRPDLAGLPFVLGDSGRTSGARVLTMHQAAKSVQQVVGNLLRPPGAQTGMASPNFPDDHAVDRPATVPTAPSTAPAAPATPPAAPSTAPAAPPTPPVAPSTAPAAPAPASPSTAPMPDRTTIPPTEPRSAEFLLTRQMEAIGRIVEGFATFIGPARGIPADEFWRNYQTACDEEDALRRPDQEMAEMVCLARMATLTEILAGESPELRLGLVNYLGGVSHVAATQALARMALYSQDEAIRAAAIERLKLRREKDYCDILVKGLRYPWPAVAKQAALAIAELKLTDLTGELVAMLDTSDPRLSEPKEKDGKVVVRELVKLNHLRNCMLCHPPAGSGNPNPNAMLAEVAIEDQPQPFAREGYRQKTPGLMIRADATYLRPDFSAVLPVKDPGPWKEMQRFDFLVRERTLSKEEAAAYREQLKPTGKLNPYQEAAQTALKQLTGKDAEPTAAAWRKKLDLPARNK